MVASRTLRLIAQPCTSCRPLDHAVVAFCATDVAAALRQGIRAHGTPQVISPMPAAGWVRLLSWRSLLTTGTAQPEVAQAMV